MTLAVQYLESSTLAKITPDDAQDRLRAALERLPISLVILGGEWPDTFVAACAEEADRAGAQLFCWHSLLTGGSSFAIQPEWQCIGLNGKPVTGFQGKPEFTFACPNRPQARQAALDHLRDVLRRRPWRGVFLDRIRYPSPAADPASMLACFCDDCHRAATSAGLDLDVAQQSIGQLVATPERAASFVRTLLDPLAPALPDPDLMALRASLDFRARSVTRLVQTAADLVHASGLAVGLDCFSPALTCMVGQDLGALNQHCQWIKIMSYAHTLGPAGIPFELLGLADWLMDRQGVSEPDALDWLAQATRLPLPHSRVELRERGLSPEALAAQVKRGRAARVGTLFAGIELVEMEGVTHLNQAQITNDLRAVRGAAPDGLVLSWDLWQIPLERLELVRAIWA